MHATGWVATTVTTAHRFWWQQNDSKDHRPVIMCYFLPCCTWFVRPLALRLRFLHSLISITHEKTASTATYKGHGFLTPFRVLHLASFEKRITWAGGRRWWIGKALVGNRPGQLFAQQDHRNLQASSFRLAPTGAIAERQTN